MITFLRRYIASINYIVMIVAVNVLFVSLPVFSIFGERFSPVDAIVGCIFIVRDFAQREVKHYIFLLMIIGIGISYLLTDKTIALASLSSFSIAETLDWAIYTFTRKPLSQRLIWSALISSPVDTFIFLWVAHRLNSIEFLLMTSGKIVGVLVLWFIWKKMQLKRMQKSAGITDTL